MPTLKSFETGEEGGSQAKGKLLDFSRPENKRRGGKKKKKENLGAGKKGTKRACSFTISLPLFSGGKEREKSEKAFPSATLRGKEKKKKKGEEELDVSRYQREKKKRRQEGRKAPNHVSQGEERKEKRKIR